MAHSRGFEPLTSAFGGRRYIHILLKTLSFSQMFISILWYLNFPLWQCCGKYNKTPSWFCFNQIKLCERKSEMKFLQRIVLFFCCCIFLPISGIASSEGEIIHKGSKEIYFEYDFWFEKGSIVKTEEKDPFTGKKVLKNVYAECDGGVKIHYVGKEEMYFNSRFDVSLQPIYSDPTIDINYQYFLPRKKVLQPGTKLVLRINGTTSIAYIENPTKEQIENLKPKIDYQCDVENIEAMGFYRKGPTFTLRSGGEIDGKGFWDHAIIRLYSQSKK